MTEDLKFIRKKDLPRLAPLIKNMEAWNALMFLLEHEEAKAVAQLIGRPVHDELVRIAAKYEFIHHLKKAQERLLALEGLE